MDKKILISTSIISLIFLISSCITVKQQNLFDAPAQQAIPKGINGFYALNIFDDNLTSEVWFTQSPNCLTIKTTSEYAFSGNSSMYWKWDKKAGNCPWMGVGFGWDGWAPKDISQILDKAAIQLKVKSVKGDLNGLPLAAALEDYSGAQAWLGFSANTLQSKPITDTAWTTVLLPFSEFDWAQNDANFYNLKQFLIQFEASGEIYVDEIKIVPFDGGFHNRYTTKIIQNHNIKIDGNKNDDVWQKIEPVVFKNNSVKLFSDNEKIYFLVDVKDENPLNNNKKDANIWNGDAFEIAFSTDERITPHRVRYRSSDRHLGVSICENPQIWDWTNNEAIDCKEIKITNNSKGYTLEMSIPYSKLGFEGFIEDALYGVEFAIDDGNQSGVRENQYRWNSSDSEGFNKSPQKWGELVFRKN